MAGLSKKTVKQMFQRNMSLVVGTRFQDFFPITAYLTKLKWCGTNRYIKLNIAVNYQSCKIDSKSM